MLTFSSEYIPCVFHSWSLTNQDGSPMETVTHIGVVSENLQRDVVSIMKSMSSNTTRNKEWEVPPPEHSRDSTEFGYGGDFAAKLHSEPISPRTEALIRDFYVVDQECLGF